VPNANRQMHPGPRRTCACRRMADSGLPKSSTLNAISGRRASIKWRRYRPIKVSELMGDVAQGIKAFKRSMMEDEAAKTEPRKIDPPASNESSPTPPVESQAETRKAG
jgi:hypothetical protein